VWGVVVVVVVVVVVEEEPQTERNRNQTRNDRILKLNTKTQNRTGKLQKTRPQCYVAGHRPTDVA
jgi:hypothetical protein